MASSGQSYVRSLRDAESPAAAFSIVESALEDPLVFFYGGILLCPGFRAAQRQASEPVESRQAQSLGSLLSLMSYGTIGDVVDNGAQASGNISDAVRSQALPLLTEALRRKLRLLSVLSFYAAHGRGRSDVPYRELQSFLGSKDSADVEDTVVAAVSNHLFKARLDPQRGTVHFVELLQARDVSPHEIAALCEKFRSWGVACERQLKQLECAMDASDASDARMASLAK